jgi:mono/diheme cytochrome c family protein
MRVTMRSIMLVTLAVLIGLPAIADDAGHSPSPVFSSGEKFDEQTGETLYAGVCRACHMANAKGASGAGHYPALADNPKLEAAGYPLTVVLHGLNGMPPVGQMMSDAQVAQVVNYVRTHFGNNYTDAVKPEDVKPLR